MTAARTASATRVVRLICGTFAKPPGVPAPFLRQLGCSGCGGEGSGDGSGEGTGIGGSEGTGDGSGTMTGCGGSDGAGIGSGTSGGSTTSVGWTWSCAR